MTAPIPTIRLISQLALGATWEHLDDRTTSPVEAAREVLEIPADPSREARIDRAVQASADLDWTGQVALAIHLLLSGDDSMAVAA